MVERLTWWRHAQFGTAKTSCRPHAISSSPTTVAPSPRTTKYTWLEVRRCGCVASPGRKSWIQQLIVGSVEIVRMNSACA